MYYPTLFASRHRHRRHPARPVARCHRPHYRMRQVYFECNLYDPGRPPGLWPVRRLTEIAPPNLPFSSETYDKLSFRSLYGCKYLYIILKDS